MTHNALQSAIRNLEGKHKVAEDNAELHRRKAAEFKASAAKFLAAIDAIYEVMDGSDHASKTEPEPKPEPEPVTTAALAFDNGEVVTEPVKPFRADVRHPVRTADGKLVDRHLIRRELEARHMYYPLTKSRRSLSNFVRQSLLAACTQHPDFPVYVAAGGFNLNGNYTKKAEHLRHAIDTLGIDEEKVRDEAKVLHQMIFATGQEGVDYT